MIELNIITAFLTNLISLIKLRFLAIKFNVVDYLTERKNHTRNISPVGGIFGFFFIEFDKFSSVLLITASLILLLTVSSGWAVLLIGSLIENNFPALSFLVFLILFLFYLFIRIYKNSGKQVKKY